jgi:hypothetical protein
MDQDQFVGIWQLVTAEFRWTTGEIADLFGPDATGMIVYGRQGQMSVQIMRAQRPAFRADDARRGSAEEIKAAFDGYLAYFGNYTVDPAERSVTHHMRGSLFPNWVGQDLKRFYEFAGDRLTLRAPPMGTAVRSYAGFLIWQRVE